MKKTKEEIIDLLVRYLPVAKDYDMEHISQIKDSIEVSERGWKDFIESMNISVLTDGMKGILKNISNNEEAKSGYISYFEMLKKLQRSKWLAFFCGKNSSEPPILEY